jgi:hypothetical protein
VRLLGSIAVALAGLAGCSTLETPPADRASSLPSSPVSPKPVTPAVKPLTGPALAARLLPPGLADRGGWASDIHDSLLLLKLEPSAQNICAVVALTEQESAFRADPSVPGLSEMARREIERRRESAGVPKFMLRAALALPSTDGRSYNARLSAATTERQLSDIFEDFTGRVPLARKFLADQNPVRTGGPMQVSVAFAQAHAAAHRYPYPMQGSIRDEVFTRRGGIYFGIAHLLHYPAPYGEPLYRFADYNAGRYASRNAAFQKAVSEAAGVPLELDGDLLTLTEAATRKLAERLKMSSGEIHRDLELGATAQFEQSKLYAAVFALADSLHGRPVPRAVVPVIVLQTAKTTRRLTTEGFARRVAERYQSCLARGLVRL